MRFLPLLKILLVCPWLAGRCQAQNAPTTTPFDHSMASVYVPLDSWVYPTLRRLADFGLIADQTAGVAPWTRAECLRQVRQASATLAGKPSASFGETASRLLEDLRLELDVESDTNRFIRVESLYSRSTGITGQPLRDSYHFGQTVNNDFGRPYDRGFNNITGFSTYGASGPFTLYFRGEFQSAPGRAALSPAVSQFLSTVDGVPVLSNGSLRATNRFQSMEMYAGAHWGFENITFGKQNLNWGPGEESAFSFSANAMPLYMLRLAQARPLTLPGPLRHLGKFRSEIVFGKLSGHNFPAHPYLTAQKISIALTDDFEIGFTRSSVFGGEGHPLTLGALKATLFDTVSVDYEGYGSRSDLPGDRHSGFDFRWRIPGARHYLTLYSDAYADDDPSPIDNPRRSAWAPGLYVSHLPKLSKMDFRFETYSTWLYSGDLGGGFIYWNNQYRDSYTNNGYLLGSWIGRDSRAYVAQASYWSSGRSKVTASYRQIKAGNLFLPGGGTQTDVSLAGTWGFGSELQFAGKLQGERYDIPVLGNERKNVLASFGVVYTPRDWVWHR